MNGCENYYVYRKDPADSQYKCLTKGGACYATPHWANQQLATNFNGTGLIDDGSYTLGTVANTVDETGTVWSDSGFYEGSDHHPLACADLAGGCTGGGGGGATSPFIVSNGANQLIFTVPATGNPTLSSTTGVIDMGALFVSNLAGTGNHTLVADPAGNVNRSANLTEDSVSNTVGIAGTGGLAVANRVAATGFDVCVSPPCVVPAIAARRASRRRVD